MKSRKSVLLLCASVAIAVVVVGAITGPLTSLRDHFFEAQLNPRGIPYCTHNNCPHPDASSGDAWGWDESLPDHPNLKKSCVCKTATATPAPAISIIL